MLTRSFRAVWKRSAQRQRPRGKSLILESLESRDLPAPLAWAAGVNLPTAGGIVAQPEGVNLLVAAGPTTTSYGLTATNPSWQASTPATVQPLDFARTSPGMGPLPGGYFLVFGGVENGYAISSVTQYDPNTVTVPDGATNQTQPLQSMNVPRAEFGWAADANDLNYAIGGLDNNGTPLASVEVYSPTANNWTFLAPLPQALSGESAVSDGAGHIYAFGGVGANGSISNLVYRYTIASNTWDQSPAPLQVGVRDSAAVSAPNGLLYVLGGKTASGATATVESYNATTNTWNLETSLPQAISSPAAAVDSLGRITVLGGYDANGNALASTSVSQELTQPDATPTITSKPASSAVVNSGYAYQVLSTGNPQPTYSLTAAPAGMAIDSSTGLISWTPTYATEGVESVTVVASNYPGQASQSWSIKVAPQTPTGLTGVGVSTTAVSLSWNASADPNVTGYNVYLRTFVHGGKGSGGSYVYTREASNYAGTTITLSGSGNYLITAVNSAGVESARSPVVFVATLQAPILYTATTTSGADISDLTLNVGQTGQIYLIQEFANPVPTFSAVTQPPSGGVSVDPTTGLVTYTPTAADIGNQLVTFAATNVAGTSEYTFTFVVLALQPTLTLNVAPVTYDGNPHAATATAVGTDGVTPVSGTFSYAYNGNSNPPTAAGSYPVVATFTSADPSYANATATGTLTINPATPTITVNSGPFQYDGNPHAATATAVGVDGVTPVAGTFQFTYNGSTPPPSNPGLYTVTTTFTSTDPNYATTTVTSNLIINSPGTLTPTLSLTDGSAPYDGNAHADSGSAVGTDGVTPVAGSFIITYNGSATSPTQVGSYAVVASFISSDLNYGNATITSTLTISAVAPTVSVNPAPFTYDGTSQATVVTAVGVDGVTPVSGTSSVTYNGSPTAPVNAGTYDVAVTFTSKDPNYLSTSIDSTMTILPATTSVGLGNGGQWQFTYNGAPQSVVGSAVGIDGVTPVAGSFSYTYSDYYYPYTQLSGDPVNAGVYALTESFTSQDPNYSNGTFSWEMIIYSATPTVTVSGGPLTYNGMGQGSTVSVVGIDGVTPVAGTTTLTYNGSSTPPSIAGTYAVVATFASTDPNYSDSFGSGTLVINKATPAFSNLASPTVNLGTSTVTLSGQIGAGSATPSGDDVGITLNGLTLPVAINWNGTFSASFNIQGLGLGTYPITYEYLGDATAFNAAGNGYAGGTLTVQEIDQWTGANFAVDHNWSDGANWSLGAAPSPSDIALFTNNSTVHSLTANVDAPFTVAGLTIDRTWGGKINVNQNLTVNGNFSLASGTVDGNGVLSMTGSGSSWSGGTLKPGSGGFTNSGTLTLSTHGTDYLDAGTLTNTGTINQSGSGKLLIQAQATLNNAGTYDFTTDSIIQQAGTTPDTFINSGTLEKTGGTGTSTIGSTLNNTGTVKVLSGTLDVSGTVTQLANNNLSGGTWSVLSSGTAAAVLDITSGTFTSIGSGATVTLGGGNARFTNLSSLATIAAGGAFNLQNSESFSTAAALTNSGTLNLAAGCVLTVNGAFTQTSTGEFLVGVGGTAKNETYGKINSTGPVTLAGKLGEGAAPSYIPPVGSAFEFIDNERGAPISGTFPKLPEGKTITFKVGTKVLTFKVTYKGGSNGMSFVITRIS
jgi:hypothetical protein